MIIGDLNGHLELLGKNRRTSENGKNVLSWIEKYNLNLLNADEKCKGVYTRCQGTQKSAIDMVLVNEEMYNWCESMEIDEEKEIINCSDHNLISIKFRIRELNENMFRRTRWEEGEYMSKDKEALKEFREEMIKKWSDNDREKVGEMIVDMMEAADKTLKKKFKKRVAGHGKSKVEDKEWMTKEIRREMKERSRLNRAKK